MGEKNVPVVATRRVLLIKKVNLGQKRRKGDMGKGVRFRFDCEGEPKCSHKHIDKVLLSPRNKASSFSRPQGFLGQWDEIKQHTLRKKSNGEK